MKAVDLGLPSGIKWADCNVGAEKETDYGLYFQFGDTVGYNDFSHSTWETCPGNGGQNNLNKSMMNKWDAENLCNDVLKPEVDAARIHMGDNWKMPTEEDFEELCKHTINGYAEIDGVRGRKFANKKDSSKYIFLPFAGLAIDNQFVIRGMGGYWWGSSVIPDDCLSGANGFAASGGDVGCVGGYRCYSLSIRGVCK